MAKAPSISVDCPKCVAGIVYKGAVRNPGCKMRFLRKDVSDLVFKCSHDPKDEPFHFKAVPFRSERVQPLSCQQNAYLVSNVF